MKRKALGLLLFLLIVPLFMGCDQATTATTAATTQVTTVATTQETTAATTQVTTVAITEATTVSSTEDLSLGTVTVEIVVSGDDPDTTEVETEYVFSSTSIKYYENDTLFDLLEANFVITYETSTFGRYITAIGSLIPTETNEYISFNINGEYAMTGVDDTDLVDGDVYSFSIGTF